MSVKRRSCVGSGDFPEISDFLFGLYRPNNRDGNWFQPLWEYAYTHPMFDEQSVSQIGIWEDTGTVVGVATFESCLGEAFFQVHPAYCHIKPEMLDYAEQHFTGASDDGNPFLKAYVNDFDAAFVLEVRSKGYQKQPASHRPISQ